MTTQKSIILFISIILVMSQLFNCDKDDNPTAPANNNLAGTWKLTKLTIISTETTILTNELLSQMGVWWTIKINSDNTFESDYNLDVNEKETGTWSTSGTKLTTTYDSGGTDTFKYSVDGNKLTLEWTDSEDGVEETLIGEFTRQ